MDNKVTLYEWLQTNYLSSNCCLDLIEVYNDGSYYRRLETNEPTLKETEYRFAKRFSEVTYKELYPYLDLVCESSYIFNVTSDLIIVEVKVKANENRSTPWN